MATSIAIQYDAFGSQFVAGTFRVTAGLKNGINIPATIQNPCRIIHSSDMSTLARLIQSAPVTTNQIDFHDIQGSRYCTLAQDRKDNTFGGVPNLLSMPNLLSNIHFPSILPDTYFAMSCYPGLQECSSLTAKMLFVEQDMKILATKYPLETLSVFVSKTLYDELMEIQPKFWSQFKQVLVAPFNLASFITEYVCGRYVTEPVSNSVHVLTFGAKVNTAQFFNSAVKATVRTDGVMVACWGSVETNFIVLLDNDNPNGDDLVMVTDKGTGVVFQPTQMWTIDPRTLHILIASNKFLRELPTEEQKFQEYATMNSVNVVKHLFSSPLKVFDTVKANNEIDKNIITFAKGLHNTIYNKLSQFIGTSNASYGTLFPAPPQLDFLSRQHSCAAASNEK